MRIKVLNVCKLMVVALFVLQLVNCSNDDENEPGVIIRDSNSATINDKIVCVPINSKVETFLEITYKRDEENQITYTRQYDDNEIEHLDADKDVFNIEAKDINHTITNNVKIVTSLADSLVDVGSIVTLRVFVNPDIYGVVYYEVTE